MEAGTQPHHSLTNNTVVAYTRQSTGEIHTRCQTPPVASTHMTNLMSAAASTRPEWAPTHELRLIHETDCLSTQMKQHMRAASHNQGTQHTQLVAIEDESTLCEGGLR